MCSEAFPLRSFVCPVRVSSSDVIKQMKRIKLIEMEKVATEQANGKQKRELIKRTSLNDGKLR